MSVTLGLNMIVKNEEHNVGKLAGLKPELFDQIVIVDTGSTDRTLEKLNALPLKLTLLQDQWRNDFADARNRAISHMQTDLVLWMDADDVLPEETQQFLIELKKLPLEELASGYLFNYEYRIDGKVHLTQKRINLFRRDYFLKWEFPVYEQLRLLPGTSQDLPHNIIHNITEDASRARKNKYVELLEKMLKEGDIREKLHAHHFLALHYQEFNQLAKACQHFEEILKLAPEHQMARIHLLQTLVKLERQDDFLKEFEEMLGKEVPDIVTPLLGYYYELRGDLSQATQAYEQSQQSDIDQYYWMSRQLSFYWNKIWSTQRLVKIYGQLNDPLRLKQQKLLLLQYMS